MTGFYDESFDLKPFELVEELGMRFKIDYFGPAQDIAKFVKLFPRLKKLSIHMVYDYSKNVPQSGMLHEEIYQQSCSKVKDEDQFIHYLSQLPMLKSAEISTASETFKWKRQGNQIYYFFTYCYNEALQEKIGF